MSTNEHESRKRLTPALKKAILVVLVVGLAGFGAYGWWLRAAGRLDESCVGCRSFIPSYLWRYAEDHDGWYPRGGATPFDSAAQLVSSDSDVHLFTTHAMAAHLGKHWKQHKTFAPQFTRYHYNEGLRRDDTNGLVVFFFNRPTFFQTRFATRKEGLPGRPALMTQAQLGHPRWEFLPEAEFQKHQSNTVAYLEHKGRLKKPTPAP